ncbi:MAG: Tripeptidyl aminopeptidase [Luteibacter sp.]|uniref:alpha/beta fold hydrolase n=1 Tax=Luteibacter sp. TaxID=1886636 RepID=UPI0013837121|nr:alpha/beta hydrolase [Luteibacter sp.]KAF1006333.1 MAG: Tripeptidyl aminopeptidase [Luteibacter sp.]
MSLPHARHALAFGLFVALCMAHPAQSATTPPDLDWDTCERSNPYIGEQHDGVSVLCASMTVPRDYRTEDGTTARVQVMRIRKGPMHAIRPAIFFNFGGPGHDPRDQMERTVVNWLDIPAQDDVHGAYRSIPDHYDLVTVVPRGIDAAHPLECDFDKDPGLDDIYEKRNDERAWQRLIDATRTYAANCAPRAKHAGIDTTTYVGDIEMFRQAAGYDRLSFYGASYGTKVALWYGATHPEKVHRVVLDGSLDVTRTWAQLTKAWPEQRSMAFYDAALQPATDDPRAFDLGTHPGVAYTWLMRMPLWLRMAWQEAIQGPEDVLAAVTMDRWMRAGKTTPQIRAMLDTYDFSAVPEVNNAAIHSAARLYRLMHRSHLLPGQGMVQQAASAIADTSGPVNLAVQCSDSPWDGNVASWRRFVVDTLAYTFTLAEGDIVGSLVCAQWPRTDIVAPDIASVARLKSVLMIHGEYDRRAPWAGAQKTLALMPQARVLLARDTTAHGLLNTSRSRCIEPTVAQFLLHGTVPVKKITHCDDYLPLYADR